MHSQPEAGSQSDIYRPGCATQDLNFTLQAWFHFGLHQDDYFKGYDKKGAPNIIEDRISDIFVPLSEDMTGKPDMIIFAVSLTKGFPRERPRSSHPPCLTCLRPSPGIGISTFYGINSCVGKVSRVNRH